MSAEPQATTEPEELGFSIRQGVDWSRYQEFRPAYPASFFARIYAYHGRKPGAGWRVAHDVGAGHGIASAALARKFDRVVLSDPNDGYTSSARAILVQEPGFPAPKFRFCQERAEASSVAAGSVDLLAACECMHWTETGAAVADFARQLRPGGTLAMTLYTRPLLLAGGARARDIWDAIWAAFARRAAADDLVDRALRVTNTAFDGIALPAGEWEAVRRVYINASRGADSFRVDERAAEDRVADGEERVWVHGDPDWSHEHGIAWFKGYVGTWMPPLPESEVQELWDELERLLDGGTIRTETPTVMVFATRKG
ncbi:S-adenosyl-L-methionine-dependent methyltransferase [Xylariomycetidae sp. FL0641]|nr:S-adenosyl-L-methionine-dependent methyltransferase [Xylariomycetidae sp. FL0641]